MGIEPQHALPDVFVWMIQEDKRIAFARIPARQIMHSVVDDERGKDCGRVMTVFLRVSVDTGSARRLCPHFVSVRFVVF